MAWQRRGDFAADILMLREKREYVHELKWSKANSREYHGFFLDLVEYFFQKPWLAFHCVVIRKGLVNRALHLGDLDLARRKHFTMLLTNKIQRCIISQPHRQHTFRIWIDPIASRYKKADEAVEVISNNVLRKALGELRPVDRVITRDSHDTPSIQMCDFFLGAVMDAWQAEASSPYKAALQTMIAEHLGWPDLRADTLPEERKFNIWYFYDILRGQREPQTRPVQLKYPLPVRKRGSAG